MLNQLVQSNMDRVNVWLQNITFKDQHRYDPKFMWHLTDIFLPPVCDSVNRGGVGTSPPPGSRQPPPGADTPPPASMLWDTVNARAVRILLECNLVFILITSPNNCSNYFNTGKDCSNINHPVGVDRECNFLPTSVRWIYIWCVCVGSCADVATEKFKGRFTGRNGGWKSKSKFVPLLVSMLSSWYFVIESQFPKSHTSWFVYSFGMWKWRFVYSKIFASFS